MKYLLIFFLLLFFSSCIKKIIIEDNQIGDDLLYSHNSINPFTGQCIIVHYKSHTIKESFSYSKGILHGSASGFYPNGNKKWTGTYRNGFRDGKWEFWDDKGNKTYEMSYEKDSLEGEFITWNSGKVIERNIFSKNTKSKSEF